MLPHVSHEATLMMHVEKLQKAAPLNASVNILEKHMLMLHDIFKKLNVGSSEMDQRKDTAQPR